MSQRIATLDAARGLLACVVVAHHAVAMCDIQAIGVAAMVAVGCFFLMSGYVLTLAYDGNFIEFAARRVVRLWPVYALCLSAGCLMTGHVPSLATLVWMPGAIPHASMPQTMYDPPAWSLIIEAWAIPLMPFIAWFGGGRRLVLALAVCVLAWACGLFWLGLFPVGAALSRYPIRVRWGDNAVLQWLGKISFSLYLSHDLVLALFYATLGWRGLFIAVPAVFLVAWGVWWFVERPSTALSRSIGRRIMVPRTSPT
jgi:peptidoglycan/LPS O-acetylase OafA/YrhL